MGVPAASKPRRSAAAGRANGQVKPVATPPAPVPTGFDTSLLEGLSHDELIGLVEEVIGGGITVNFSGKANATRIARKVRPRVVRRIKTLSVGDATAQAENLLIEGDNLQAMATLYRERGQVDLILTDPPYNTGNDFRYNDRWEEDPNDPGMGELVSADDGARHTKWMRFMWPRLQMMRSMLKPGGVLAICIDYRELFRLGQMLDELFGEHNRLGVINWQRSSTIRNDKDGVSTATEYVLVYARDGEKAATGRLDRTDRHDAGYRNPDNDPEGPWNGVTPFAPGAKTHRGMVYGVQHPFTGELIYPTGDQCWKKEKKTIKAWFEAWGSEYVETELNDGKVKGLLLKGARDPRERPPADDPAVVRSRKRAQTVLRGVMPPLIFTRKGEGLPRLKTYLGQLQEGVVPSTFWADDDYALPAPVGSASWPSAESGTSEAGNRELTQIVGANHGFETVKPMRLFSKIVQIWAPDHGLVVDPFAGSGTTGHAVLDLNATTGSSRRFILIEQGRPERGDPYASSLTANRLKRVVTGDWASGKQTPLGGGFSFLRLDKRVDAQALLDMERDEMVDTVIASHFDANRKRGSNLIRVNGRDWRYLVAKNSDDEGFFLVWDGPDKNTDFSASVYDACASEAEVAGLKPYYHVYARLYLYQTENVRFYQIPDRILADFGLDMSSEPFTEPS